jgi:hypothetical protein
MIAFLAGLVLLITGIVLWFKAATRPELALMISTTGIALIIIALKKPE